MPEPQWPVGPTYFSQQHMLPPLPVQPEAIYPYQSWGAKPPTRVWSNAGCPWGCAGVFREAGQNDTGWFAALIADPQTPNSMKPYLERNQWPPEPGSPEYMSVIRPQFRYGPAQEQHWIDWWYGHFTSDSPGPRYTIPTPTPPTAEPTGPRPPRDWPDQEPLGEPGEPTVTVTTTGTPVETTERPTPWGWIIGGCAVLLLVGGGVAYVVTRPKKRRDGGRRRRRRRR